MNPNLLTISTEELEAEIERRLVQKLEETNEMLDALPVLEVLRSGKRVLSQARGMLPQEVIPFITFTLINGDPAQERVFNARAAQEQVWLRVHTQCMAEGDDCWAHCYIRGISMENNAYGDILVTVDYEDVQA